MAATAKRKKSKRKAAPQRMDIQPPLSADGAPIDFHHGQIAILKSWTRVTVAAAGTGGGKTLAGYYWLLSRMRAVPGQTWLVGFPTYPLLRRVILNQPDPDRETLLDFLRRNGLQPEIFVGDRRISCSLGQILFASAGTEDSLKHWEGSHVRGAWIDEFDSAPYAAFKLAMERTRRLRGWVLLTGTPRRIPWAREHLLPYIERGDPDYQLIQFESTDNPTYSREAFEEARATLPTWEFERLYQGKFTVRSGGGVFRREWWQYLDSLPPCTRVVQFLDTAFKKGTVGDSARGREPDYSVCATWGEFDGGWVVIDIWRERVDFPELKAQAQRLFDYWGADAQCVEDAASGISLIQELRSTTRIPVIPVKVDRDKYSRASSASPYVRAGRVFLPRNAKWVHDFVEEHAEFPNGAYDDQVDTTSMAIAYFRGTPRRPLFDQELAASPFMAVDTGGGVGDSAILAGVDDGGGNLGPVRPSSWDV